MFVSIWYVGVGYLGSYNLDVGSNFWGYSDCFSSLSFPAMHTHVAKIEIASQTESAEPIIKIIKKYAYTGEG